MQQQMLPGAQAKRHKAVSWGQFQDTGHPEPSTDANIYENRSRTLMRRHFTCGWRSAPARGEASAPGATAFPARQVTCVQAAAGRTSGAQSPAHRTSTCQLDTLAACYHLCPLKPGCNGHVPPRSLGRCLGRRRPPLQAAAARQPWTRRRGSVGPAGSKYRLIS